MDEHTLVMVRDTRAGSESLDWYTFIYKNEDGFITRTTMLHREEWEAIGSPDKLTVTIMPGDTQTEES